MKEVIAVIRPEKWQETIDAAQAIGLTECSHVRVMGRGKQRGLRYMRPVNGSDDGVMQFLPKRMLSWLVPDERVGGLVRSLITSTKATTMATARCSSVPLPRSLHSRSLKNPKQ